MVRGKRARFTSAHAIAIAALFFALGGGAYAAVSTLPPNSVGTKQLQNKSVTPAKLAPSGAHALTVRYIRELKKIVKRYSRPGPPGPAGLQGAPGANGAAGPSDVYIAGAAAGPLTGSSAAIVSTTVPPGEYLIQAKTTIFATATNASGVANCQVGSSVGGEQWDGMSVTLAAVTGANASADVTLASAASFSGVEPVVLSCRSASGSLAFDDARVWATRVGSLHGLPVPTD